MDDEDISERKLKIASILDRVKSFKTKYGTEENWTDELTFTKSSADTTEHSGIFTHLVTTKTPEEWQNCLLKLENTGLPQVDRLLLNKLIDNYSQAVGALSAEKHSSDERYAQILVRFAELKVIHDPDEARDQFQLARLNCKKFAFVHTAFAQFELSEGNFKKCKQILRRGLDCGAVPTEMLELALKNLQLKKPRLISDEDKENLSASSNQSNQDITGYQNWAQGNLQRMKSESPEESSIKTRISYGGKFSSPEDCDDIGRKPLANVPAKTCAFGRVPIQSITSPDGKTWNSDGSVSSSVVKRPISAMRIPVVSSGTRPKYMGDDLHGSEDVKVFQVMDEKKLLYAIKYVNLHEADQQTIESYQNEISHLNKLQQHSDKIIKLYDYEITNQHIYMVMECGNIDLNTWLRKKKTVNPWERKSYWKNMLEAVHTIHKHGIVHSDLKPANFLIVDGMLKLIDFGIANQIQPDVTSIVKDSQVGTINYMPPEAIKDTTSYGENGRPRSKISPKGDVWSLGCILYCMTYGKTPFQHITNQISKLHAILDPGYEIEIPNIPEKDLQDVLRKCLVRNPKERISIAELLVHPYVQIQSHTQPEEPVQRDTTEEMKRILGQLIGLNSPNSISRAAKNLYDQFNSGKNLDLSALGKTVNQSTRTMK
ncbi:hypothetical protein GDO86_009848 [Hymenochirus boettgeri]|uniref:Dual specificity protein kinase TTK n=1 Tax=Hymenochirus boettgeri TaxID=247094 RepID=A0A8T2JR09_9PIPI|nr:hypothetical protein GDO86_009848 [Hymenochirus boettgeri]